ncbi:hypothetical protein Ancab_000642 [Ancistrocladus abbreviatus]
MLPFPTNSSTLPCSILLALAILMAATTSNSSYTAPTTMLTAPNTTKPGCQRKCGNLTVPYPFGIIGLGSHCSLTESYDIICDTSFHPPKAFLNNHKIEIFEITETHQMRIENNMSYACYDPQGAVTKKVAAEFQPLGPSYTLSADANRFTVVGCDDYALFSELGTTNLFQIRATTVKPTTLIGGCIALCSEDDLQDMKACPGLGCCQTSLPKGLKSFSLSVTTLNNHTEVSDFDKCGYAFLAEKDSLKFSGAADLKVEASVFEAKIKKEVPVVIEWTVGTENCSQAQLSSSGYACQQNTKCVDFDGGTAGYRCQCLPGYEGNPYLSPGCTDIDECADPNNNPCVTAATCNNTVGGYTCICPIGQLGDGKKTNSSGCIPIDSRSQSATKFGLAAELEKATDSFNEDRILGQGGQGTVYKGMLSDGKIVAIKKSKIVDQNQLEEFINEVVILSQINHRNIDVVWKQRFLF